MNGEWIWLNGQNEEDSYGEFKAVFPYREGRTELKVSADSEYAVFVNGEFVYAGQYADFPWYKIHDTIDLTPYLKAGENECVFWVWYCGDRNFCHYINRPALRFEILCGGETLVQSDEETLARPLSCFDSGLKKLITQQIGYSFRMNFVRGSASYFKAERVGDMPEQTFERPIALFSWGEPIKAKKVSENVYDLGAETVGLPYVIFKGESDEILTVSFGEWLKEDGGVPRRIGARDFSFELVGDGERRTAFNPLRKIGCRYFETEGSAKVEEIGLIPLFYPFQEKAVEIDDPLRKKIYEISVRTLKLNAFEHYYDCPWREQAFYALDSRQQMRYGYRAFENNEYQYAALKLMSEDWNAEGQVSIVVPTSDRLVIPSFTLFYLVAMEEYASETGDIRLLREYFGKMTGIAETFISNRKEGLVSNFKGADFWNFYEWNDGLDQVTAEHDSALNFTFLLALKSLIRVCGMLGENMEAERYIGIAEEIGTEINRRYFDGEAGLYRMTEEDPRYFELLNAYALLTGVADGEKRARICEKLVSGELIQCTLSMLPFKYDALLAEDTEKYRDYVLSDIDKNYAHMLKSGATSFWETLKGAADFGGAGSLCHGWAAAPIAYYHQLGVVKSKR